MKGTFADEEKAVVVRSGAIVVRKSIQIMHLAAIKICRGLETWRLMEMSLIMVSSGDDRRRGNDRKKYIDGRKRDKKKDVGGWKRGKKKYVGGWKRQGGAGRRYKDK